ncbi:hypothetical protein PR048_000747 [Dryococelus australis]|uniref:DDE-1 domain-containing protein n=1 Tax=Dryococelus australis TaxID=614101 RepID=A0ABQ9IFH0_9NEOP|nr:hypothetical protein PR048_000747 [Dryococelus australis]
MDQHDRIELVPDGGGTYRKYSGPDIVEAARMVQEDHKTQTLIQPLALKKIGPPFALEPEIEQKVFNYVISMQELGFGLTVEQVKVIAFDVAEASGYRNFFNKQKRLPENLSAYRASMGNPVMIDDYFDKLSETTKKLKIQNHLKDHIWNFDETGRMYVMKLNKVVAEIGKKFIYSRTYTERGETMALVGGICTNGTCIPPFIIFKGSHWNEAYKKDSLPNTQVHLSDRGWITKELFLMWFQFFLDSTGGSPKPMLLFVDSHGAHITPQVIKLAKENDVHILTFPSHTTHILQPLDVGVYKALKSAWKKELNDYMAETQPTSQPSKFFILFSRSWGIVPSDRTVIPKEKLVPSLLTERPVPEEVVPSDANPRPTTAETNPGIQTPPSPVDNILKLQTASPRKEPTRGRVSPNPKAKLITENPPTMRFIMQPLDLLESNIEGRLQKKTNVCVSSARPTVDDDDWTCDICNERFSKDKKVKNGKKWAQCSLFLTPYHERCQSEPVRSLVYMCEFCSSG